MEHLQFGTNMLYIHTNAMLLLHFPPTYLCSTYLPTTTYLQSSTYLYEHTQHKKFVSKKEVRNQKIGTYVRGFAILIMLQTDINHIASFKAKGRATFFVLYRVLHDLKRCIFQKWGIYDIWNRRTLASWSQWRKKFKEL